MFNFIMAKAKMMTESWEKFETWLKRHIRRVMFLVGSFERHVHYVFSVNLFLIYEIAYSTDRFNTVKTYNAFH